VVYKFGYMCIYTIISATHGEPNRLVKAITYNLSQIRYQLLTDKLQIEKLEVYVKCHPWTKEIVIHPSQNCP